MLNEDSNIVSIPFHSQTLQAVAKNDSNEWAIAMKPVCENLSIDFSGQLKRLKRQPWATVGVMTTVGSDGKLRDMVMLDRQTFVMWLATVEVSRIKSNDVRNLISCYQKECAKALDSYFCNGVAKRETPEQTMARALLIAKETIERGNRHVKRLEAENRELAPKALFADAVAASDNTMLVGELAKLLASNGISIGQNRLFAWLRGNGYLMKDGSWKNMPTQRSMDMGLFVVKETAITHADGHVTLSRTPKVTGKGQRYFVGRFLDSSEAAFDSSIRKMLDNERRG